MDKKCKKCGSKSIKKDGFMRGKQRWKCLECGYVFQNSSRNTKQIQEVQEIWEQHTHKRATYKDLADLNTTTLFHGYSIFSMIFKRENGGKKYITATISTTIPAQ